MLRETLNTIIKPITDTLKGYADALCVSVRAMHAGVAFWYVPVAVMGGGNLGSR